MLPAAVGVTPLILDISGMAEPTFKQFGLECSINTNQL